MQIKRIEIKSFRGVKNKIFDLKKFNIFEGKNGVGKTTCLDAVNFVLTGETFVNGKTTKRELNQNNTREVSEVSLVVEIITGGLTIEKTYTRKAYEHWKKPRGSVEEVFDKIAVDCIINGTTYTKDAYEDDLLKTFGINFDRKETSTKTINIFRMLTDLNYLDNLEPKVERAFLNKVCNIPSDLEMLENEEFEELKPVVVAFNMDLDKTKKFIDSTYTQKQAKFDVIAENLDNAKATIESLDFIEEEYEKDTKEYENEKEQVAGKYNELMELQEKLEERKKKDIQNFQNSNKELNDVREKLSEKKLELEKMRTNYNSLNSANADLSKEIFTLEGELLAEKKELERLQNIKIEKKIVVCEKCGFENEIFNKERELHLEEQKTQRKANIKSLNDKIEVKKEKHKENLAQMSKLIDKGKELNSIVEMLDYNAQELSKSTNVVVSDETTKLQEQWQHDYEAYKERYGALEQKSLVLVSLREKKNELDSLKKTISSMYKEKEQIAEEVANIEIAKDEYNQFLIYKNKRIEEIAKEVFGDVEFVLVETSANGSETQKCYARYGGVEFGGLNTAQKTLVGIKVLNSIRNQIGGKDLPILFDIADNIGNEKMKEIKESTNAQILCTMVERDDTKGKELTIRYE